MYHILLVAILIVTIAWHLWKKYSPCFSFTNIFFFKWHIISTILQGKGPRNESLYIYLFRILKEICMKHLSEGLIVFWIGRPTLVVYGPEATKFFATERSVFDKPTWVYQFLDYSGKDGIMRSSGKRAKKQRKLLSPPFYPRMMKHYVHTMNDHAMSLVQELRQLENQITKDIGEILKSRLIKLFYEEAFGIKTSFGVEDSRATSFIESTKKVMEFVNYRLYRPWLHFDFMLYFFSAGRNHMKDTQKMNFVAKQITDVMRERYLLHNQSINFSKEDSYDHGQFKKCFGDSLFEEHLKDPSFTLFDLQTEIINLIVGGYDTSSHCLMWTFWLLGLHPDIQEQAYEEINQLNSEFIDCEDAANLTYLECIIKESFRIYPVVPAYARLTSQDLYFKNHKIPSGTTVVFAPYLLHRNPELYPEPEVFKPDRFLENQSLLKPFTLTPFAESIRSCIGKNYAMLELKIFLAYVLRNFKIISLTPKEEVDISWEVMLKSSVPLSIKFIPR